MWETSQKNQELVMQAMSEQQSSLVTPSATSESKKKSVWEAQDIVEISDVSQQQESQFQGMVSAPPTIQAKVVQGIDQLNQQVMTQSLPSHPEEGVDLSILLKHLRPLEQVTEVEEIWDYDSLQRDISLALRTIQEYKPIV